MALDSEGGEEVVVWGSLEDGLGLLGQGGEDCVDVFGEGGEGEGEEEGGLRVRC